MTRIKTRIKVIEKDDETYYVPQSKGYISLYHNISFKCKLLSILIPGLNIIYIIYLIVSYIFSLFYIEIPNILSNFKYKSLEYAQEAIDDLYSSIEATKKENKSITKIRYIKYP